MKKILVMPLAILGIVFLFQSVQADEIDNMLAKAKKEGKAVMLELGSVGCKPCEEMRPVMEKLKTSYAGRLEIIFIDIKKNKDAVETYDVFFMPTQVLLDKNGKEFNRHYGLYPYEEIVPVLKKQGL